MFVLKFSLAPGCGTPNRFEGGFDHAFYRFRQDTRNFAYSLTVLSKFQYSTFIVNMCEHEFEERALAVSSPATFLVHSRWGLLSDEERAVYRAFSKAIAPNRKPRASDLRIFVVRLRHGEYVEDDVLFLLCNGWACNLADCLVNRDVCAPFWARKAELERRTGKVSVAFNAGGGLVPKDFKANGADTVHPEQRRPNAAQLELAGGVAVSMESARSLSIGLRQPQLQPDEAPREGQQGHVQNDAMLPLPLDSLEQEQGDEEAEDSERQQQEAMNAAASLVSWPHKWPGKYYMWSNDFHPTPLICNAKLYNELGLVVHGEIDFGHCAHFGVCKERLKVLEFNKWRGFSLDPCPNRLRRRFFEAYKNDPELQRMDVVICSHPVANCELFMPFNRSMIVYATTRLEFGRDDDSVYWRKQFLGERNPVRWRSWMDNLRAMATSGRDGRPGPRNVIAANNAYDAKYIQYFTGLDVKYLPSWCGDAGLSYTPVRSEILLGASRDNLGQAPCSAWSCQPWQSPLLLDLKRAIRERTQLTGQPPKHIFVRTREMYRRFTLAEIASHPAMVVLPYQSSLMFVFEVYRLNVPLFVPSPQLLLQWHLKDNYVAERVYGHPQRMLERFGIHFAKRDHDNGDSDSSQGSEDQSKAAEDPDSEATKVPRADDEGTPRYISAVTPQSASQQLREHQQLVSDPCNFWRRRVADVALEEMPDPNSDERAAFEYWTQWYDYYQWPYTSERTTLASHQSFVLCVLCSVWFHSWDHLLELLEDPELDLHAVSARMATYNEQLRGCLKTEWAQVFEDLFQGQEPGQRVVPTNLEQAFRDLYGKEAFSADDQDEARCERETPRFIRPVMEDQLWLVYMTIALCALVCAWLLYQYRQVLALSVQRISSLPLPLSLPRSPSAAIIASVAQRFAGIGKTSTAQQKIK